MSPFLQVIIGFTIANLVWQFVQLEPNWPKAIERSYFQAFAVGYLWLRSTIA